MTITRETILHLAELIGAVLVIWGAVKMIVRPLLELVKHDRENYLNILRLTMVSTEMPIEERLIAGEKYINGGGNGAAKVQHEALKESYQKELKKHEN